MLNSSSKTGSGSAAKDFTGVSSKLSAKPIKRVAIFGPSGTGKTTLSKWLSKLLGLEIQHLDKIRFDSRGRLKSKEQFDLAFQEILNQPTWIIDGLYWYPLRQPGKTTVVLRNWTLIETQLREADLIIFMDFSIRTSFTWLLKRKRRHWLKRTKQLLSTVKRTVQHRASPDKMAVADRVPQPNHPHVSIIERLQRHQDYHRTIRPRLVEFLRQQSPPKQVFYVSSQRELKQFRKAISSLASGS